ncbi:hypothetical protein ACHAQD_011780 [Fusarium lateritium]
MRSTLTLLALGALGLAAPSSLLKRQNVCMNTFNEVLLFDPPPTNTGPGVLYARSIQLQDKSILATFENYEKEPPTFPIYKSADFGRSWDQISEVVDTHREFGMRWQPHFYILPRAVGDYPAGTLLVVGNVVPDDFSSTNIDIYASRDDGVNWEFVSSVASGGPPDIANGKPCVWEPHLLYYDGQVVVYYADQRDPAHGQKVAHQLSSDLVNWSDVINDAAESDYNLRPGMPAVAKLGNDKWILAYELVNFQNGPIFAKIANSPLDFNDVQGVQVIANGRSPGTSPYVQVTRSGRIIVSGGQTPELFVNDADGAAGQWRIIVPNTRNAYSRGLSIITDTCSADELLLIIGAGWLSDQPTNRVIAEVRDTAQF